MNPLLIAIHTLIERRREQSGTDYLRDGPNVSDLDDPGHIPER